MYRFACTDFLCVLCIYSLHMSTSPYRACCCLEVNIATDVKVFSLPMYTCARAYLLPTFAYMPILVPYDGKLSV